MGGKAPKYDAKSGLRKIFKAEFELNPSRYEFRANDPGAPACPFGNTYAWIGFDRKTGEYVRLVKSILKDQRLNRVVVD